MDIVMMTLIVLTAAWTVYLLTRLPAPEIAGAKGSLRQMPASVGMTIEAAVAVLFLLAVSGMMVRGGGWQAALLVWGGALLFLMAATQMAFDGVRWSGEGLAFRDALGRRRFLRWEEVLAARAMTIPHRGRGFDQQVTAVYLPGQTLLIRRTLEGHELPFLRMLREKRPDLPDTKPEGCRDIPRWPEVATWTALAIVLLALVLMAWAVR